MGLLKQDHNAIKLDLRAAVVLYPKRLPKNGQFKPVCGRGARHAWPRMQYWKSLCMRGGARAARDSSCMRLILRFSDSQKLGFSVSNSQILRVSDSQILRTTTCRSVKCPGA